MAVRHSFTGTGLSKELIDFAINLAKHYHINAVRQNCNQHRSKLRAVYENEGRGNASNKPFSSKVLMLSADETWMRDPMIQNAEELEIYHEIFDYIIEDLSKIEAQNGIITEGAAFLPELMHEIGVNSNSYICIIPTKDFQYHHYKLRPWVPEILKDCTDKKQAFENWMERDALFAITLKEEADKVGYRTLTTDGTIGVDCIYNQVVKWFQCKTI